MDRSWIAPFLRALAETGVVAAACRRSGANYNTVYKLRREDDDFAAAFAEALEEAVDEAELEAWRRGVKGYDEPVIHQGQLTPVFELDEQGQVIMDRVLSGDGQTYDMRPRRKLDADGNPMVLTVRKHSDPLLMFVLKGRRKVFATDRTEITGADGAPVQLDETTKVNRLAQLLALAQARKDYGDIV